MQRTPATIVVRASDSESLNHEQTRTRLVAAGGILGALAASSCCIIPLVLFSLGISGAWIGNLTALFVRYASARGGLADVRLSGLASGSRLCRDPTIPRLPRSLWSGPLSVQRHVKTRAAIAST